MKIMSKHRYLIVSINLIFINLLIADTHTLEIQLSNGWSLTNQNHSVTIDNEQIPSGVYSALENAKITDSIVNSFNDVNLRWIGRDNWTYSLDFDVPEIHLNHSNVILVLHGIDTVATVTINDIELFPKPNNMFVRYRYDVKDKLNAKKNRLEIAFESPIDAAKQNAARNNFTPPECPPDRYNGECHMNFLRKMQASFAWDWGLAAPSVGIWKPVILEVYDTAIIRDVTYALKILDDQWQVIVDVYLEIGVGSSANRRFDGYLALTMDRISGVSPIVNHLQISNSESDVIKETIVFNVPRDSVDLWWPNGYGDQTLYDLKVSWHGANRDIFTNEIKQTPLEYLLSIRHVRIGFRTIELIEDPLNFGSSFYFKINGVAMFMKGTNWIPSDILPERMFDEQKIDYLLSTVQEAHMNVIRVWGGGVYESDYFYQLADERGILIWQDMMFACAMYPVYEEFLDSVKLEIEQNIRRLQSHPSILVWAGNNENEAALVQNWYGTKKEFERFFNEYIELYENVVETTVKENDQWHIWLMSSPSNGNKINASINQNPQDNHYGDVHYYNYILDAWNSNIFPKARFVSEYGFQSFPSMHSLRGSMYASDNLTNLIEHRQHFPFGSLPIVALVNRHLPLPKQSDKNYWDTFIYFSQLSQAMVTKTETETYRIGRYFEYNTMGSLYWQLNDVWFAPSWSSIEYNGNFKILQYWAKQFYSPIHIVANIDVQNKLNVFIVRDTLGETRSLQFVIKLFKWNSFEAAIVQHGNISMPENSVELVHQQSIRDYFNNSITKANSFLYFELRDSTNNKILSTNFVLLDKLKKSKLISNPHLTYHITSSECDRKSETGTAHIQVNVSSPAIFVYVQVKNPDIESYQLSKNGFIQLISMDHITISFYSRNCAMAISNNDIQILTVNDFLTT